MKKESSVNSKIVHVMKRGEGWVIRKHGAMRATKIYSRKDAAVKNALKFIPLGLDVVIHHKDGTIQKWEKASIKI
ncbi:MAG: DUF2188 domain-containing protein [Candidatus Aminicenantes bacterium]|nr:DUF2188 domain-containing protein [Candidatus Aminicenantes bacterium]